jgi:hypothetical protein
VLASNGERGFVASSRRAGRGKNGPPGGHRLVSRKRIVSEKEKITENKKLRDKIVTEKGMYALSESYGEQALREEHVYS